MRQYTDTLFYSHLLRALKVVLVARSREGLETTASAIRTFSSSQPPLVHSRANSNVTSLFAMAAALAAALATGAVLDHLLLSRAAIVLAVSLVVFHIHRNRQVNLCFFFFLEHVIACRQYSLIMMKHWRADEA